MAGGGGAEPTGSTAPRPHVIPRASALRLLLCLRSRRRFPPSPRRLGLASGPAAGGGSSASAGGGGGGGGMRSVSYVQRVALDFGGSLFPHAICLGDADNDTVRRRGGGGGGGPGAARPRQRLRAA